MRALAAVVFGASAPPPLADMPTFDLGAVMARVAKEHRDWSQDRLNAAEHSYRLFLADAKANPERSRRPSLDADEVWHAHILNDTRIYARDTIAYAGRFIHHVAQDEVGKDDDGDCRTPCTSCLDIGAATCDNPRAGETVFGRA